METDRIIATALGAKRLARQLGVLPTKIGRHYNPSWDGKFLFYSVTTIARLIANNDRSLTRTEVARAIRLHRNGLPSRTLPDTLGWRVWNFSSIDGMLMSPVQNTPWYSNTMIAYRWSDDEAIRGAAGIHARRMPHNWRRAVWDGSDGPLSAPVSGIVERFDRYVLGEIGWRAERVTIRALRVLRTSAMRYAQDFANRYQVPVYHGPNGEYAVLPGGKFQGPPPRLTRRRIFDELGM